MAGSPEAAAAHAGVAAVPRAVDRRLLLLVRHRVLSALAVLPQSYYCRRDTVRGPTAPARLSTGRGHRRATPRPRIQPLVAPRARGASGERHARTARQQLGPRRVA